MSNKLTITLAAAATTLLMAGSANAVVIDYAHTWDGDNVPTSSVSGANVNSFNDSFNDWSGGNPLSSSTLNGTNRVSGDSAGEYAAPLIAYGPPAGTDDPTHYYSVPRTGGSGDLALEFGDAYNYFGLLWGSIDDYNTIEFLLDGLSVVSLSGDQVTAPSAANGDQQAPSTNTYVNFYDLTYDEVRFSSSQFAFEFDNIAVAQVPEPAAVGMFGVGLLGLGLAYRRRKAA